MFNRARLDLARKRRRLTWKRLAELSGVSPVTLSRIANGSQHPDDATVGKLATALGYPRAFLSADEPELIEADTASFRSLSSMAAKDRDAALSAGTIGFELVQWIEQRFDLPDPDILDLEPGQKPAAAARMLRQYWALGEQPISNMIALLEFKGIRVFSLSEHTKKVDAFSIWKDGKPFIFLNTFKSAERTRFDAAHELGHLIMHRHAAPVGREAEIEANQFASAFLMPEADVISHIPYVTSIDDLISAKHRWGVSVVALAYRLHKIGVLSEWLYIQANRSFRSEEPAPRAPEKSVIWEKVLRELWRDGYPRSRVASELLVPEEEIESLIFGLVYSPAEDRPERSVPFSAYSRK